ncbi:Histidine biosynthesis trifunctional protein [Taphrina deformans PYCC 5710]|uniref:Histidine biosynthesis trifunctional protein n=1 Tax=Taphrina deformans (strain PYCC 5710 / ATCC 11124 / CBS 356.35 / IMI 108563 / JCM 9778 / NBRC 8474) TaxID=1097556 RepID=R4XBM1_TAPDE|nr:Histidine biosynthesis trifunctional protein [Taphrina deformans PYCC 5710]|eukprot:CCG80733.1 Histidine biosynthesis trifunctional protein [Taphrina deformans PYCC 5710]
MKLLPIVAYPFTEGSVLPRQSLQHIGQILVRIEPQHADDLAKFVDAHFELVKVVADVTKLEENDTVKLLNAGVVKVICVEEQNNYVPEDRRLNHFVTEEDLGNVKAEEALFFESSNPDLQSLKHLPASLTLITPVENLRLPEPASPDAPASLGSAQQLQISRLDIAELFNIGLKSDRPDGLYPTLVCNARNESLGLVYSSARSIAESLRTGQGVYESRKRGLWYKGATSGDTQRLISLSWDCDDDALKFVVDQQGSGFCHLGQSSCFGPLKGLSKLESILYQRAKSAPEGSYTARLFTDSKLLRAKILEEAEELCDANTKQETAFEAADLLYFALTMCVSRGVSLNAVEAALDKKALKVSRRPGNAKPQYESRVSTKEEKVVQEVKQLGDDPPIDDNESLNLKVYQASEVSAARRKELLRRPIKSNDEINNLVKPIIHAVRTRGDSALLEFTKKFDGADLSTPIIKAPFAPELMRLSDTVKRAIDQAFSNIQKFHQAQLDNDQPIIVETMPGVVCSRFNKPIESVGLYVPGGTAVLPSTAMMLGIPALVAGCTHIVFASPPRRDGSLNPEIVYIAHKVGAEAILLAGGAQAVAALAYGTDTVRKCDKILGPGNQFVTAAKGLVSGDAEALVSIDMPAGPSEVLIIADSESDPAFVASDLLSQAEHGADSQSILVGANLKPTEIDAIKSEVVKQALALPRCEILKKSIAHSYVFNAANLDAAIEFSNAYAPEHLIVYTANSAKDAKKITNAGSIFVGAYSPVACGDYASGTNHTLPTYGYARQYSGVNTGSFLKAITSQEITQAGLKELGKVVMTLAEVEGLDAHKNSVHVRIA